MILTPDRKVWLDLQSHLDSLGLALVDTDTELAKACFELAAKIDDRYGITSAENKLMIAEALTGTAYERLIEHL